METGNPNLKLLFFTDTLVENELHKKYQKLKVKGEWYKLGIIELKEIMGSSKNIPKTFFYKNTYKNILSKTITDSSKINMQVTINYDLVWQLKTAPNYQFTDNGICINTLRGKQVRKVVVSGTKGNCIKGKFRRVFQLRKELIKIEKSILPF